MEAEEEEAEAGFLEENSETMTRGINNFQWWLLTEWVSWSYQHNS